jgi:hypothetical protein
LENGASGTPGPARSSSARGAWLSGRRRHCLTPNQNIIIANVPAEPDEDAHRRENVTPKLACGAIRWPASRCRPAAWRSRATLPRTDHASARLTTASLPTTSSSYDRLPERLRGRIAEIGLVGKGPAVTTSISAPRSTHAALQLYAEDLDHAGIVATLDPVFAAYARSASRTNASRPTIRAGFVARTGNRDFANTGKGRRTLPP